MFGRLFYPLSTQNTEIKQNFEKILLTFMVGRIGKNARKLQKLQFHYSVITQLKISTKRENLWDDFLAASVN